MATTKQYHSLKEFYPYYLSEHRNPTCRVLHFIGTSLVFVVLFWGLFTQTWLALLLVPLVGYAFAAAADRMDRPCLLRA